jgi:hypothetical protein
MARFLQHLTQTRIKTGKKPRKPLCGAGFRGRNVTDQKLHSLSENQLRALYNSAPAYLQALLKRKRVLEEGIVWELSIPQRAAPNTY